MKKKQFSLFMTLFLVFSVFLLLFSVTQEEKNFYTTYHSFYKKTPLLVNTYTSQKNTLDVGKLPQGTVVQLSIPSFSWDYTCELFYGNGLAENISLLEGHFFEEKLTTPAIVAGKKAFQKLTPLQQKERKIVTEQGHFPIIGILNDSPFNDSLLLNLASPQMQSTFLPDTNSIHISADSPNLAQQSLQILSKQLQLADVHLLNTNNPESFDFTINAKRFQTFYFQLILFSLVALALQFYQRFNVWQLELAIRKLVGANPWQLVWNTFSSYLKIATYALLASLSAGLILYAAFRKHFSITFPSLLIAMVQMTGVYVVLMLVFLAISYFFVKKTNVTTLLREVHDA